MPRKKKEEELETEGTSTEKAVEESVTEENSVEALADENPETPEMKTASEESTPGTSIVDSIAETVGAAVGSLAATVSDGISSVVSAVTGDSSTNENDKSESGKTHHSKRAERIGIVQSDKMTKTVTVRVDRQVKHPIYRKYIKRRKKFMAHDELGSTIGDKVRIIQTRPLSARKRWRVVEILQKAVK